MQRSLGAMDGDLVRNAPCTTALIQQYDLFHVASRYHVPAPGTGRVRTGAGRGPRAIAGFTSRAG